MYSATTRHLMGKWVFIMIKKKNPLVLIEVQMKATKVRPPVSFYRAAFI